MELSGCFTNFTFRIDQSIVFLICRLVIQNFGTRYFNYSILLLNFFLLIVTSFNFVQRMNRTCSFYSNDYFTIRYFNSYYLSVFKLTSFRIFKLFIILLHVSKLCMHLFIFLPELLSRNVA